MVGSLKHARPTSASNPTHKSRCNKKSKSMNKIIIGASSVTITIITLRIPALIDVEEFKTCSTHVHVC